MEKEERELEEKEAHITCESIKLEHYASPLSLTGFMFSRIELISLMEVEEKKLLFL